MAERAQATTGDLCPACPSAAASAGAGLLQCVCGTWHGADDARWPRPTPEPTTGVRLRPGLDAPAGTIAPPTRPPARIWRDAPEVARVRRLLAELRPHGPGAEEPLDGPAEGKGASLAPRTTARPPWDVDVPKGAFQRDVAGEAAGAVVRRIASVPSVRARAALEYLRPRGTLAFGYAALAVAVAHAVADAERLASWQADEAAGYDRARVWGGRVIDEACAAWEAVGSGT